MADLKTIASGTMIGFTANKTETEAKADTSTNRVDICTTKQLYLNGERLGLTDAEVSYLTEQVEKAYNARMSVGVSVSPTTIEKGTPTSVKVTITTKWDGANVQPSSVPTVTGPSDSPSLAWDSTNKVYTFTISETAAKTITAKSTYNNITKSASAGFSAYNYFYVGLSTEATLTSLPSSGFTKKGLQSSAAGTYNLTFTAGQYAYFLFPSDNVSRGKLASIGADGYYHAAEGVSDVPFIKQSSQITIGSIKYDVFRLAAAQAASTHAFTI